MQQRKFWTGNDMAILRNSLSDYARRLFEEGPSEGTSYDWIRRAAGVLSNMNFSANEAVEFLRDIADEFITHRHIPNREIENHVAFCFGYTAHLQDRASNPIKQGDFPRKSDDIIAGALADYEPICSGKKAATHEEALAILFNPGDILCVGESSSQALAAPYPDAASHEDKQFITANPLKMQEGTKADGLPSIRCQSNIALRRHLVVEFDTEPELSNQARLHAALSSIIPCALVVYSGGKSLHGWYNVETVNLEEQTYFFSQAALMGCDTSLWDTCKWVRMPGGLRDNGQRQLVLYIDEEAGVDQSENTLIDRVIGNPQVFKLAWDESDNLKKQHPHLTWRETDIIAAAREDFNDRRPSSTPHP